METIYQVNNLPFFDTKEIRLRRQFEDHFALELERTLRDRNPAWRFAQIEAPMLIPDSLINAEYERAKMFTVESSLTSLRAEFIAWVRATTPDEHAFFEALSPLEWDDRLEALTEDDAEYPPFDLDLWVQHWAAWRNKTNVPLVLRPETTPASYAWLTHQMEHQRVRLPFCVWQANKSFRREQDQPSKHMRLKEFWQQEFQCAFAESTADDYQAYLAPKVQEMLAEMVHCPTRIVPSDRLPKYSRKTLDVEVWNSEKWMEVCSISLREDFSTPYQVKSTKQERVLVVEVAIGLDRCVYCHARQQAAWTTSPV